MKRGLHTPAAGILRPRSNDVRIVRLPVDAEATAADDAVQDLLPVLTPPFGDEVQTGVRLRRAGAGNHVGEHVDVTRPAQTGHATPQLTENLKAGRYVLRRRQRLESACRDEIEIPPCGDRR